MSAVIEILLGGLFHAAVLFLVAAGLQLVFGVQKIVNLACGSFYAIGAYFGISAATWTQSLGLGAVWSLPVLIFSGVVVAAVVGPVAERVLRTVYARDESFQLLLTFALVLIIQDILRFVWGPTPQQVEGIYLAYGRLEFGGAVVPAYNILVMVACVGISVLLGAFLQRTNFGRILRATAENRDMAAALGVDVRWVYASVFTLGTALGTIGGALVVPSSAASLDMAVELVVEAFAVVVIGGLGSMRGVLAGAIIVGLIRAAAILVYPEFEILSIYVIVVLVLLLRPAGLFGKPMA